MVLQHLQDASTVKSTPNRDNNKENLIEWTMFLLIFDLKIQYWISLYCHLSRKIDLILLNMELRHSSQLDFNKIIWLENLD